VAIVHDWLNGMRGGEKALEAILELFPQADIFTLLLDREKISASIRSRKITTSFVQHMPFSRSRYRHFLPLFPLAVESFDLSGYDLVISTSHCVAKGARPPREALHVCYCFSPMRYVWVFQEEYFGGSRMRKVALAPIFAALKWWDKRSCDRVDDFLAISRTVAERIETFYGRKAEVIYPPVDTDFFVPGGKEEDFYLVVSAVVPYKRVDIAIGAFNELRLPLVVIGEGPEYRRLRRLGGKTVSFRGWVTDEQVREAYQGCRALIFPGMEDFGLVPVEAQACGKPVIAFGKGGVTESVLDGETGIFFREQTVEALVDAVKAFRGRRFDPAKARENSLRFSQNVFKERMLEHITHRYKEIMPALAEETSREDRDSRR
jgi:glycosyltransferase involved in cell wall biosynthesis